MICQKCGSKLAKNAKFCANCGAEVSQSTINGEDAAKYAESMPKKKTPMKKKTKKEASRIMMERGEKISDNIVLCADGKYRWIYEMSLYKNPAIFLLIWKIFFFIFLFLFTILIISDLVQWGTDGLVDNLKVFGYIVSGMTVVVGIGYLLYAVIMGGKYCVMFEMDEAGVNHKQMPSQARKAELLSVLTVMAGMASKNVTTIGSGLLASRTEMYSDFSKVSAVKPHSRTNVIGVNEGFFHNQVYTAPEDFDFVLNYITSHCPNLKD